MSKLGGRKHRLSSRDNNTKPTSKPVHGRVNNTQSMSTTLDPVTQRKNDRVKEGRITKRSPRLTRRPLTRSQKATSEKSIEDENSHCIMQDPVESTPIVENGDDVGSSHARMVLRSQSTKETQQSLESKNKHDAHVTTTLNVTRSSASEQIVPAIPQKQNKLRPSSTLAKEQKSENACHPREIQIPNLPKPPTKTIVGIKMTIKALRMAQKSRESPPVESETEQGCSQNSTSATVIPENNTHIHPFNDAYNESPGSMKGQHGDKIQDVAEGLESLAEKPDPGLDIEQLRYSTKQAQTDDALPSLLKPENIYASKDANNIVNDLLSLCVEEDSDTGDLASSIEKDGDRRDEPGSEPSSSLPDNPRIPKVDTPSNTRVEDSYVSPNCIGLDEYIRNIRVFLCLQDPEVIAHNLTMWEDRHGIDQIIDNQDKLTNQLIPLNAKFMIVAEDLIWSPMGSVVYFATQQSNGMYSLKVSFYYCYLYLPDCNIYSISEWLDTECTNLSLVSPYETIGRNRFQWGRFKEMHKRMVKAVDAELESRKSRPKLRNVTQRRAWRVRSAVQEEREIEEEEEEEQ
jgi:hypothetical protein